MTEKYNGKSKFQLKIPILTLKKSGKIPINHTDNPLQKTCITDYYTTQQKRISICTNAPKKINLTATTADSRTYIHKLRKN